MRKTHTDTPADHIQTVSHALAGGLAMTLLQHDAMLRLRGGAPILQRTACRMAIRGQMDVNKRRPTVAPNMTPLGPTAGIPASTSTSQTAAAPGVVVEQPVSQQAYVPSYRVPLFGEALLSAVSLELTHRGTQLMHHLVFPIVACPPSAIQKRMLPVLYNITGQYETLNGTPPAGYPDALKFNGPGPELINGRLAQWGFVSAALGEAQTGKHIAEQLQDSWPSVLAWSALIIWASLVPITKGAKRESFGGVHAQERDHPLPLGDAGLCCTAGSGD